jgi:uncharacterized membrane protein (UPF0182 family)
MSQSRGTSSATRRLKRRATAWAIAIGLGVVLLTLSSTLVSLAVDWLWFDSLGQRATFQTRLFTRAGLWAAGLTISLALLLGNWLAIPQRIFGRLRLTLVDRRGHTYTIGPRVFAVVLCFLAVLAALVMAGEVGRRWMGLLTFVHAVPFGLTDPLFGLDVGFYVFRLPIYRFATGWVMALLVLAFLGSAAVYAIIGRLRDKRAAIHLSVLVALFLFTVGADYQWQRFGLLTASHGAVFGAGYTDVVARLPLLHLLTGVVALGGMLLLLNFIIRRWRLLLWVAGAWLALWLLGSSYPQLVQRFTVQPNELALERPYLEHNIRFTRIAYGLEGVAEDDFAVVGQLTKEVLAANADTVENVRLWDWRPMRTAYEQLQEIRTYYTFVDVDVDRYTLDGRPRQVMLAARELDVDELREDARTWVNQHLIYTHGYGVCLSPVNEISQEGLPTFWVRDVPPQSTDPALEIRRPEIYFGEATDNYVIVNTSEDEFDYPQGDQNVYTRYAGPDGVRLGGLPRRALFASYFDSNPILFSSALGPESRILFRRSLSERVRALAPMLWFDEDPYPVLVNGRIVWLYDAYTVSSRFPYSTPAAEGAAAGLNYIRNSVKVTVDAYTGETTFYIVDPTDPLILTYRAIFPTLFTDGAQMDPQLRAHWRYPEQLFRIQADTFAAFHMQDARVFYNQEDLWQTPTEILERGETEVDPYYVIMRLPGAEAPEFLLIRPYVPASKQNMIAWLYADSDGEDYGELGVYKFPKEEVVYGPIQVEGRFDQDAYISQQLTLWNQRGSSVIRGNMMVVPLDGTLLYIEPLYLQAEAGRLPELKRVLVAHGNRVTMADNLAQALAQVLGEAAPTAPEEGEALPSDAGALARSAQAHYEAAQACLQRNDWACYGAELDALGADLEALVAATANE